MVAYNGLFKKYRISISKFWLFYKKLCYITRFLTAFNLPESHLLLMSAPWLTRLPTCILRRPMQCVPAAHPHQTPRMSGTKNKTWLPTVLAGISYHVLLYLTFWFFLILNFKKNFPMKLLGLTTYFDPIEVTKFLPFISEGVISLSLLSTLSVHFRNQSIISIVFEANQKMCWEKLTLLIWNGIPRTLHPICLVCVLQVVPCSLF